MSYIGKNIKKIRTVKNLSQAAFAQLFNLARPSVGAYEEGRSEPKIDTLVQIAQHFGISVDLLLTKELTINELYGFDIFKKGLSKEEVLKKVAAAADSTNQFPLITGTHSETYPVKSADPAYVSSLPTVSVPLKQPATETRAFEITTAELQLYGVQVGDIALCTATKKNSQTLSAARMFAVVTTDSIRFGKLIQSNNNKTLQFEANLPDASDLEISMDQVQELWEIQALISYTPTSPETKGDKIAILEKKVENLIKRMEKLEQKDKH
ncbi:helix-turn-helix domain-containing protein [Pontibacter sp. MBLB2868]|uniref:helix-turn-helix domain-containing protein n=1 Tax=Pontibacter sp. MBLB2868 TaxID=3451555 RepID=UPI003F7503D8